MLIHVCIHSILFLWHYLYLQCNFDGCDQEFTKCSQLKLHQFVHMPEKPFRSVTSIISNMFKTVLKMFVVVSIISYMYTWPRTTQACYLHFFFNSLIINVKKLLDSDWVRAVQFKCNTSAKSATPVQKV